MNVRREEFYGSVFLVFFFKELEVFSEPFSEVESCYLQTEKLKPRGIKELCPRSHSLPVIKPTRERERVCVCILPILDYGSILLKMYKDFF